LKNKQQIKKIVLTGPESTGKTTLASYLSNSYNTLYFPEFAREYIENLKRDYTFEDVENIAKQQIKILRKNDFEASEKCVFFDTGLIITKVWFQEVFGEVPQYINDAIKNIKIDLYLLCYPDIKWVRDAVRENGGEKRLYLFNRYKEELDKNNNKYLIIRGNKNKRFALAEKYLSSAYCL
jgi:NadR type nicotinamide-nucleotide adenylyltransferase